MKIYPMKTEPVITEHVWGGKKLAQFYNKGIKDGKLGKSLELSGSVLIAEGPMEGLTVNQLAARYPDEFMGKDIRMFPYAVRLEDTSARRTPRVHPDERGASGMRGHYEMLVILSAEIDAGIYAGLRETLDEETFLRRADDGTLTQAMFFYAAKKDDIFLIPGGLLHALGGGITALVISVGVDEQYKTDEGDTSRTWGYISREMRGTKFIGGEVAFPGGSLCEVDYAGHMKVTRVRLDGKREEGSTGGFRSVFFTEGSGVITAGGEARTFKAGDTFVLAAEAEGFTVEGRTTYYLLG